MILFIIGLIIVVTIIVIFLGVKKVKSVNKYNEETKAEKTIVNIENVELNNDVNTGEKKSEVELELEELKKEIRRIKKRDKMFYDTYITKLTKLYEKSQNEDVDRERKRLIQLEINYKERIKDTDNDDTYDYFNTGYSDSPCASASDYEPSGGYPDSFFDGGLYNYSETRFDKM